MATYFASEGAVEVANEAVQNRGGDRYTTEFPVERLYRDAKVTTIEDGTTEIHTGGCPFVKIFTTPEWRNTSVWDSHQYQKNVIATSLLGE